MKQEASQTTEALFLAPNECLG